MSMTPSPSTTFLGSRAQRLVAAARDLGQERLRLLSIITGGHIAIHWFQQLFPLALQPIKAGMGLSAAQAGTLSMARQFGQGTPQSAGGHDGRQVAPASGCDPGIVIGHDGVAYMLFGSSGAFGVAFAASVLLGFGTALWHPRPRLRSPPSSRAPGHGHFGPRHRRDLGRHPGAVGAGSTTGRAALGEPSLVAHRAGVAFGALVLSVCSGRSGRTRRFRPAPRSSVQ